MKTSYLKNLKQERQQFAYDFVSKNNGNSELKSIIEQLGMMIYANGLISTIAYLNNTKSNTKNELYKNITLWLKKNYIPFGTRDLLQYLLERDYNVRLHIQITKEVLALTDTYKEMAKTEIN
ncbi:type III-B CRISPR module-associated protein Cmr5 [Lutibacter maritimus]|uniref:CRISPR type III-B/RAMP module-associated protein Cmr5 n=1 Tax=Lutibacter maritimus TaxID=593133 RepID=A0A1I6SQX4_9FLAO|nr:type III-B CRISPR module-associated protein Cmr5 [Lutibacter maritimus]SFS79374.1 CRISPR type III-B/RAMP module-associated protein Cmr5 [Lutibacter maritimus]